MKRVCRLTAAALFLSIPFAAAAKPTPLPRDPNLVCGELSNGLDYIIRKHETPPGKMSMMLHIDTGSLNETDAQQGLAHFLEHMAFNGSKNFPPGKVVEYFESLGMEFGGDINAFTSFDQTAYMLFTPDTKRETIDKALLCLSDQAFRLLLLEEEIEKERGVILEEARSGQGPQKRIRDKLFPQLFPNSRFSERLPIGKEELIATFPREEFVNYYEKWYRPDLMTLILVGDAEPERLIPLIEKNFGKKKAEGEPPKQHGPEFQEFSKARAIVVSDPEIATAQVGMWNLHPPRPPVKTEEQFREDLVSDIGGWIAGRRFQELVQSGEASFRAGSARTMRFFDDATAAVGSAVGDPKSWNKMLEEMIVTVSRAREHGFTKQELELARKEFIAAAERAVERESTTDANRFVRGYNSAVNDDRTILSAEAELALYKRFLPTITVEEVNEAFAKAFSPGSFAYVLTVPEKEDLEVPKEEAVLAAAKAAQARKTVAKAEKKRPETLLESMPNPGKVVEQTRDEDLEITSAWLENGVRVHHRFMDYEKDKVLVSIRLAGGEIEETKETRGVSEVAVLALSQPATDRLTSTDVRDLMTGKKVSVGGGDRPDQLALSISGSPDDLEAGLQLAHALLTEGKIEESALKNWRKAKLESLEEGKTNPRFQLGKAINEVRAGSDPRLKMLEVEHVERQKLGEAQQWFDRIRRTAPIEVAVVGDIQLTPAMELVKKYLGSLPDRPRQANFGKLREIERGSGPFVRDVSVETMTPMAFVFSGFLSCEERDVADSRALQLAANVLTTRMIKQIREEKRLVYSIRAGSMPSKAYRDSGLFYAAAPTDPEKSAELAQVIFEMFDTFAKEGPSEQELANAKKQVADNLDKARKRPAYWLGVLADLTYHERSLEDEKQEEEAFAKMTGEEVRKAFSKYYKTDRRVRVVVTPTEAAAEESVPEGESQATGAGAGQEN